MYDVSIHTHKKQKYKGDWNHLLWSLTKNPPNTWFGGVKGTPFEVRIWGQKQTHNTLYDIMEI